MYKTNLKRQEGIELLFVCCIDFFSEENTLRERERERELKAQYMADGWKERAI